MNHEYTEHVIFLKPQDVFVLLKLCIDPGASTTLASLGAQLGMSASEIHGAMNRAASATLLDREERRPRVGPLLEFLEHGIRYVFISRRGEITRGVPTAHSAPPLVDLLMQAPTYQAGLLTQMYGRPHAEPATPTESDVVKMSALDDAHKPGTPGPLARTYLNREPPLVWPHPEGEVRGESLEPLYPSAVDAARRDAKLYELLALLDALRVGRARDKALAIDQLKKRLRSS
jgi:hypothetical protein